MADLQQPNNWSQYEKLVIAALDDLKKGQKEHTDAIKNLEISHATMKAEASRDAKWTSGIGAFIGVLISSGIHFAWKR